jgi:DeoR family fructose operon transcriptional repressor
MRNTTVDRVLFNRVVPVFGKVEADPHAPGWYNLPLKVEFQRLFPLHFPPIGAKESQAVEQKRSIAQAAAQLINADDFVFIDAGSTTLELVRALAGDALKASYVTNGVAHARALARKGCRVYLPGGLLRPETEAIVGAPTVTSLQRYNFTKAFMGANGVALDAGFTTPDPEEAAVKAAAVHRAREAWFLVDDAKFSRIYPAVIADLQGGAILTNRCPNPKYKQFTLVKETEV